MIVVMTHVGGPLDGTIEFEENADPTKPGPIEISHSIGTYFFTKGEIGKGAFGISPAVYSALQSGDLKIEDGRGKDEGIAHEYYITSNEVIEGKRHVSAEYRPRVYKKNQ